MEQAQKPKKRILEELYSKLQSDIDSLNQAANGAYENINAINSFKQQYIDGDENTPSIPLKINKIVESIAQKSQDAEEKHEKIVDLYTELFTGSDESEPYAEELEELKKSAHDSVKDISLKKADLAAFHERVFGKMEGGQLVHEGFKQLLEQKVAAFDTAFKNQEARYKALFEQIESLLPGATSIGLAKAYEDQRESYTKPLRNWSIIFVSTMCVMLGFGSYYFIEISKITDLSVSTAAIALLNKLPFFVPTIWLALYASKKQSQYKRLQQEYAFKETFAKSYDGHKRQIEALEYDPDTQAALMQELLSHLVTITSQNPSSTLDNKSHNDETPFGKMLERLPFSKGKKEKESTDPA